MIIPVLEVLGAVLIVSVKWLYGELMIVFCNSSSFSWVMASAESSVS